MTTKQSLEYIRVNRKFKLFVKLKYGSLIINFNILRLLNLVMDDCGQSGIIWDQLPNQQSLRGYT